MSEVKSSHNILGLIRRNEYHTFTLDKDPDYIKLLNELKDEVDKMEVLSDEDIFAYGLLVHSKHHL